MVVEISGTLLHISCSVFTLSMPIFSMAFANAIEALRSSRIVPSAKVIFSLVAAARGFVGKGLGVSSIGLGLSSLPLPSPLVGFVSVGCVGTRLNNRLSFFCR